MNPQRIFLTVWLAMMTSGTFVFGQSYDFQLKINGLRQPETIMLGYWYGGRPIAIDSAKVDSLHPTATFAGTLDLPAGVYFFGFVNQNLPLDFVLNNEYQLRFSTHATAILDSVQVDASRENVPFFQFKKYERRQRALLEQRREAFDLLRRATRDQTVLAEQANSLRRLRDEADSVARSQRTSYPDLLFPRLIEAELMPQVPADIPPVRPDGGTNFFYIQYLYQHFWDGYDFADVRLLRSAAMPRKVDSWLKSQDDNLDSVQARTNVVIARSAAHRDSKNMLLQLLAERFDRPSMGGNEAMLVWLFDQHYPSAAAAGIDTATWMRLEYKANVYRPTLPGLKAPDIVLPDTTGQRVSLHELEAQFTIVYFFSPLCSRCQQVTPEVYALTQQYADRGVRVLAVCADGKLDYWRDYVRQNIPNWTSVIDLGTPSPVEKTWATSNLPNLYLLDAQKTILARNFPISELSNILQAITQ
jgi:thiol-disulfide isomerase/thioredoxin